MVQKYQPRQAGQRQSKLDPFKGAIVRLLAQHPYTAAQLLHRLKESGYAGGYSILKAFVQQVRPSPAPRCPWSGSTPSPRPSSPKPKPPSVPKSSGAATASESWTPPP